MSIPIVYGAAYSVYVRAVRLALEEKGAAYRLEEVDVFARGGPPAPYLERHPFGKIPAFEHDGFKLYEAGAITRYVDEALPGPRLMPGDAKQRARVNQAISVLDSYFYPTLVWGLFVERVDKPARGVAPDEAKVAAVLPRARTCLRALNSLTDDSWFACSELSLADLHAAPMFAYALLVDDVEAMMEEVPRLGAWWAMISRRGSMAATKPQSGTQPLN
jgi:glutathione S-transferase